jgi:hypothetical protein
MGFSKALRRFFHDNFVAIDPSVSRPNTPSSSFECGAHSSEDLPPRQGPETMPTWKGIVGKAFTPDEFDEYVRKLTLGSFKPVGVTIHHCGAPSLAQRPNDFQAQHMLNLQSYYRDEKHWSAGPHLFIDRQKIWVFTPLTERGIHAVSFNGTHWGIEMLGDYDVETPNPRVLSNTYRAASALLKKIGRTESSANFHRDDPKTSKTCPGTKIDKATFRAALAAVMAGGAAVTHPVSIVLDGKKTGIRASITPSRNIVEAMLSELNDSVPGTDVPGEDQLVSAAVFYRNRNCAVEFDNATKTLSVTTPRHNDRDML